MTQVRVMSYSIFRGGRRGSALHEVVRGARPDVLVVNESPKAVPGWQRRCRRLAEAWGMELAGGGRSAGSNLLLTGSDIRVKRLDTLVFAQEFLKPRSGLVVGQLRVEGRLFGVVGAHLSLTPERRAVEVESVIAAANSLRGPVVVAGDLNEPPTGPSWRRLREAGFTDHGTDQWKTFPAESPDRRIDALLVRGVANVLQHGDPGVRIDLQAQASDHRGVLAVLDL